MRPALARFPPGSRGLGIKAADPVARFILVNPVTFLSRLNPRQVGTPGRCASQRYFVSLAEPDHLRPCNC